MADNKPLHAQLYEEMLRRIHSGAWAEGEQVPSERSLIAEFDTSRAPVRQALAALRADGLIIGGRGTPSRVQRIVPSQSFETFVSFTEWAHQLGRIPGQRVIEAARRAATDLIALELNLAPGEPVVQITRLRTLDGEPAMLERSTFPLHVGVHLLVADLDAESIYQTLSAHHLTPARARHVFDAVAAEPLDVECLGVALGAPLLRVRRCAYDDHGAPVELADDRYVPGMATFAIENAAHHRTTLTRVPAEATGAP